jgi:hypothetical protein
LQLSALEANQDTAPPPVSLLLVAS